MSPEDLAHFEARIAELFNEGRIPYPVHLESGNEPQLVEIFRDINPEDWVLCSWRSHLKCLLKGVAPEEVEAAIMRGESMALCFPEFNIVSSAIVGGTLPIAVGVAMGLQRSGHEGKVHCFLGDMTARGGMFHECVNFSRGLPIRWIVEDNGLSVCTPTAETWPGETAEIVRYRYTSQYPHAGAGQRVQF